MITKIFILICLAIFIHIQFIAHDIKIHTAMKLGAFYPPRIKENNEYYRFITCHFIHIDFLHFLMNAYALYDLGTLFESLLGTIPYLYLILMSMLLSSLLCYSAAELSDKSYHTITIGASGVVYGFFGAICALAYFQGSLYYELLQGFLPIIAINFIYTLFNPQVSKTGHIGGFIGGVLGVVIMMVMNIL
jgi:rhomboid protease GluP